LIGVEQGRLVSLGILAGDPNIRPNIRSRGRNSPCPGAGGFGML